MPLFFYHCPVCYEFNTCQIIYEVKNNETYWYTDGSCLKNPGFGGWAYILRYNQHQKEGFGAEANTTNNRMELKAIIEALKALKEPCEISLFTDSNLMVQSINEWLEAWIKISRSKKCRFMERIYRCGKTP